MVGVVVVVYLSIDLSIYLSIHLSNLSIHLSVCLSIYLSVYLQSASLKRSYSARPPQILNLTTSKTQQFCETSSIFWQRQKRSNSARLPLLSKLRTSKRKQLWETSFNNGKFRAELTASCQCVLRFFHFLSKVLRLPRKSDARSYEVLHLSRKIICPNLKIWFSKMQPLSGNQRPDLLTCLLSCHAKYIFPDLLQMSHACHRFW